MVLKLTPVGVVVFIPEFLREDSLQVRTFIDEALKKLNVHERQPIPTAEQNSPDELRALVDEWAAIIGVQPKRVTVREMYRKWGSCSSKGSVTLNVALCRVPRHLAEYVVCHELIHLLVFNHGKDFKALMTQYMPDWREREKTLNTYLWGKT